MPTGYTAPVMDGEITDVIVNAGGGDEAVVAKRVADTIRNMEARRGN